MRKERKTVFFAVIVSILISSCLLLYYEEQLYNLRSYYNQNGKLKQEYTADEIVILIKQQANYLGDSITVYEDGSIRSSIPSFQGTINHVTRNPADIETIEYNIGKYLLPRPVVTYMLAAHFYLNEYPEERARLKVKTVRDSVSSIN